MIETWKDIEGYTALYQISNLGRVKSLARTVNGTLGGSYRTNERILNPPTYSEGYKVVKLFHKGICQRFGVHVLVARAFIPNNDSKPMVNHRDGNKSNNHWGNLEWVTSHENHLHAAAHGLKAKGERHGVSKLNNQSVKEIKELLSQGVYQRKIALKFNVCQASIKDINRGATWNQVIILVSFLLFSCSADWHLRQAIKKGAQQKVDTAYVMAEIPVPEVKTDTVFSSLPGDTIRIEKERLKIKYVKLPGDSVYIEGKCEADTIVKEIKVPIVTEIQATKGFWFWLPWILVVIVLIIIAGVFSRKR